MKIIEPSAALLAITPEAQKLIETAGRVCWQSESKDSDPGFFIRRLIKNRHLSVLEHASATFRIICDRACANEIVRHRLASYSQESTRYCKYDDFEVINPGFPEERHGRDQAPSDFELWETMIEDMESTCLYMANHLYPQQIIRAVYPLCMKTELVMTANFREWRHFIKLRYFGATGKPHPQIQKIAELIYVQLAEKCPDAFNFGEVNDDKNGG